MLLSKVDNQDFFSSKEKLNWDFPPIVVAWDFNSSENLGALLRVCDNFGINEVFFVGSENNYRLNKIKRNATTSFKKVNWQFISHEALWDSLPKDYIKIAVDTTSNSKEISKYCFNKKYVLFFGNETIGLSNDVLQKCNESVFIPMLGNTFSMNVVQCAAVTLYEVAKQNIL